MTFSEALNAIASDGIWSHPDRGLPACTCFCSIVPTRRHPHSPASLLILIPIYLPQSRIHGKKRPANLACGLEVGDCMRCLFAGLHLKTVPVSRSFPSQNWTRGASDSGSWRSFLDESMTSVAGLNSANQAAVLDCEICRSRSSRPSDRTREFARAAPRSLHDSQADFRGRKCASRAVNGV